jgi:ATP phosphoribosyltransferase
MNNNIKLALPKGRLLNETASLLMEAGWGLTGYHDGARLYHIESSGMPDLSAKIFQEKDIPVQIALGNYDLGICGLDWIEELTSKYPGSSLFKVRDLGYGQVILYLAASRHSDMCTLEKVQSGERAVCIASEYPNLAESMALDLRLKRFNIFPVWGAAEIYPPENADLVLIADGEGKEILNGDLVEVTRLLSGGAFLVANKTSWETKDLSRLLDSLYPYLKPSSMSQSAVIRNKEEKKVADYRIPLSPVTVRLALPDGHQQKHTVKLLKQAGIDIFDYPSETGNRRPAVDIPGVTVKVIRPQDMPLQVANGNFDLAISGRDWLQEHLYKFPSSPVAELLDFDAGKIRIVAAVHQDVPADDIFSLRRLVNERSLRLRIASEYTNIADKYARDNRLGMYRIVPTWGATEAFVPDDADMLIENTETGRTLAQHNLKIIDTLFESIPCLVGDSGPLSPVKEPTIKYIVEALRKAAEES